MWAVLKRGEHIPGYLVRFGTTAIRIALEIGANVVAADLSPLMRAPPCATSRSDIDGVRVEVAVRASTTQADVVRHASRRIGGCLTA